MTNKVLERTEIQRTGRKQLSGSTHDIWFYRTLNRVIPSSFCSHHTNFLSASLPSSLKKLPGIVGHQLGKRLHALRGCTTPKPCNHQLPKLAFGYRASLPACAVCSCWQTKHVASGAAVNPWTLSYRELSKELGVVEAVHLI